MNIEKKMKLVIVSERTRNHFQDPLIYFNNIEVWHLYKNAYADFLPNHKKNLIRYKNIFDLWGKLKKINPDIIQTYEPYYGFSRLKIPIKPLSILKTIYYFSIIYKKPYYYNALETIKPERKFGWFAGKIMKTINYLYAEQAKLIFTMTDQARDMLIRQKINRKKIINNVMVGHWGVNADIFKPSISKRSITPTIIFIGTLNKQKGANNIISIHDAVKKNIPALRTIIIGDGVLAVEIEERAKNSNNDIILFKKINYNQIQKYLNHSWIIIAPYRSQKYSEEQTCASLLEAMACGLPVVAFASGAIPRYIKDKQNGYLVPEGDITELINGLVKLLKNDDLRKKIGKINAKYAKEKFDARNNISKLESIILNQGKYND